MSLLHVMRGCFAEGAGQCDGDLRTQSEQGHSICLGHIARLKAGEVLDLGQGFQLQAYEPPPPPVNAVRVFANNNLDCHRTVLMCAQCAIEVGRHHSRTDSWPLLKPGAACKKCKREFTPNGRT